ncbi:hypothetical protein RHMOL_Rhmol01G0044500 [Rhododendron molle]|uniref:Uncharacterized protein n=1 Tax=Rhododendron molle TaxID=49168 RepID=A0ACC0PZW3_RHOML|nr:hypothetical protein RHMOL_Rhmol01G0044500 [Rhododendron molle]
MESSLLFWVMMMSVLGWRCFGCLEQERHALLTLKANINYPYFDADGELSSWEAESTLSCCEWERVECNNSTGRVTGLSLFGTMTADVEVVDGGPTWLEDEEVGYFNGSLFLPFEELVNLDLSSRGLAGLRNLQVLDLSGNLLNRTIQSLLRLDDFVSLKWLDLSSTQIKSFELVQGLSSLSNLEDLYLGSSCLNDNFLQSIGVLASLKVLALSNGCLRGNLHTQGNFQSPRLLSSQKLTCLSLWVWDRPDLYDMERYKLAAGTRLQKQFKTLEFEQLVDKLMELEYTVRACYHKYLDIEGNTLMWIMAIDGLFLLVFLQIFTNKDDSKAAHLVDSAGGKLSHDSILSDVMLLENQIPFFLFSKIISVQISPDDLYDNSLLSILTTFCHSISPVKLKIDFPLTGVLNHSHLLDLLYHMIVPELADQLTQEAPTTQKSVTESKSSQQADSDNSCQIFNTLWANFSSLKITKKIADNVKRIITRVPALSFLAAKAKESTKPENSQPVQVEKIMIPSASYLSKIAGVEFCPTSGDISTVKFDEKEKKFYLPIITLNVHSEAIIRNLIAYEASTVSDSLVFARYTELLDGIIDTAEDAKLLREKKIIVNKLKSDDAVLQLFDGIGKSVRLTNAPYFDKTIEDVNKFFYNSRRVRIYSGMWKYVFGSWKILTFFAGILLLLLTGLQSFCSVYTCSDMINSAVPN